MPTEEWGESRLDASVILELIDPTEYLALTATQKDYLKIILSCGTINMNPDHQTRDWLLAIFPSGNTYDALVARFFMDVE